VRLWDAYAERCDWGVECLPHNIADALSLSIVAAHATSIFHFFMNMIYKLPVKIKCK
jgi:hypothetical protein